MTIRIEVSLNCAPRLGINEGLAYAAGLFDGEGCIHIAKQKSMSTRRGYVYRLVATVAQNHLGTLIDFQTLIGIDGRIYQNRRTSSQNRDVFTLNYDGSRAAEMLRRLYPLLLRKGHEAKVAISFQTDCQIETRFGRSGCPEEIWKLRDAYYRKLRKLK